jgi:hypothetical protein
MRGLGHVDQHTLWWCWSTCQVSSAWLAEAAGGCGMVAAAPQMPGAGVPLGSLRQWSGERVGGWRGGASLQGL